MQSRGFGPDNRFWGGIVGTQGPSASHHPPAIFSDFRKHTGYLWRLDEHVMGIAIKLQLVAITCN